MGILEGFVSGLFQAFSFDVFPYLLVGSLFGLIVGVIPGLSGHFAMAMAIPFLYTMEPNAGVAFILGAHATVAQGGWDNRYSIQYARYRTKCGDHA